jgi:hypothetical protein
LTTLGDYLGSVNEALALGGPKATRPVAQP